jgi:hypothetical protein
LPKATLIGMTLADRRPCRPLIRQREAAVLTGRFDFLRSGGDIGQREISAFEQQWLASRLG